MAVQVCDYHDMCKGKSELTGMYVLSEKLLNAMGYKTLAVPYTEFRSSDKIVNRVQYLESKLKSFLLVKFINL